MLLHGLHVVNISRFPFSGKWKERYLHPMRTLVMGDTHGAYKAVLQCLQRAGFDYERDRLIQLGDVADGFDEVYLCVEELMKIKNLVSIRGNHDDWFYEFMQTGIHPQQWEQGGKATAISYLRLNGREQLTGKESYLSTTVLDSAAIPYSHQQFFASQRLYYIDDETNCFVHGGFHRQVPFTQQLAQMYYWDRSLWMAALSYEAFNRGNSKKSRFAMATPFTTVFIGHTPTLHWKKEQPIEAANVYNLDTGAGHGGRLTIMDVHTRAYWQSDPTNTLYDKSWR